MSETELQQIANNISNSILAKDNQMLDVSIQDLRDISSEYKSLELECRFVAVNGDKIVVSAFLPTTMKIRSVNGATNHVLFDKYMKLLETLPKKEYGLHFKHLNDMSPEEYIWCKEGKKCLKH